MVLTILGGSPSGQEVFYRRVLIPWKTWPVAVYGEGNSAWKRPAGPPVFRDVWRRRCLLSRFTLRLIVGVDVTIS